jgi:3-hydroxybutyrate dehydrogenase
VTASAGSLDGRRALVTGAASGIGAACARALARAGAHVIVADLDAAGAEAMAGQTGGEAWVVDPDRHAALEALALDVDILVNNAGVQHIAPIDEFPPAEFQIASWAVRPLCPNLGRGLLLATGAVGLACCVR